MEWYYNKGDKVIGPVSEEEIHNLITEKIIGENTLLWNKDMEDWKVITEVSEFKVITPETPPTLPKRIISSTPESVENDEEENSEIVKTYYDSVTLHSIETRVNGVKHGNYKSYYPNGELSEKGIYKDGKKDGLWEKYYQYSGQLWNRINYKDGKLHGLWERYYEHGDQLSLKGNYKDGELHGLWESYYSSGQIAEKETYKDGRKVGEYED